MSSEPIATSAEPVGPPEPCRGCGAPLAEDQRYCLECGERRTPMSSVLSGGPPASTPSQPPPTDPSAGAPSDGARGSGATVIAGVGVLLLAIGVGVLIGRSGANHSAAPPAPQVITVSSAGSGGAAPASEGAAFSDDWPSATNGYTVQLQTLPVAGSQVGAVEAAKSAASAKGAKGVGALKSEDFSSLTAGKYVIYSGVYHKRPEAQKALAKLKKSFPAATVVKVSNGAAGGSGAASPSSSTSGSGAGSSPSHPAPPAVVESLKKAKSGKSYEEQSKKLPNVISTG
ncbi:MAG TPA: hypothetical protein VGH09_08275 [Solirubrobacteraceae bacterium]